MAVPWDFQFDDDSDDMMLDSQKQLAVTGTLADIVALRIRTRLRTVRGEHFLNRDLGVPYFDEVLEKNPDELRVKNLLLSETLQVEGVKKVIQFDAIFEPDTRVFRVKFKVLCEDNQLAEGEV